MHQQKLVSGVHGALIREALAPSRRGSLAVSVLLGFAAGLCAIGQAVVLSRIVHDVILPDVSVISLGRASSSSPVLYTTHLAWLFGLATLRAALVGGSESAACRLAAKVKEGLRQRLMASLVGRGPAALQTEQTGELVNTFSEGIEGLDAYYAQYLPQLFFALSLPLLMVAVIFRIDWVSGLILLLTGPLIPLFMILIGDMGAALAKRQWSTLGRMSAFFFDVLQGLATLKMLGQSKHQDANIFRASQQYRRATMAVMRVTFLSAFVLELLSTLSVAVVAVQIGLRLLYGQMSFQSAFLILILAPEYYLPLRLLALRFHASTAGAAAGERVFDLLKAGPELGSLDETAIGVAAAGETAGADQAPEICLSGITFAYPGGPPILRDLSCCFPAGKVSVLSGPSGAGKSTLAGLLLGFWKLSGLNPGTILVDGQPVSSLPFPVAWVPQRPYLFHASVADNIRLGHPGASDADVVRAAGLANADAFIRALPKGYQTMLGERGLRLSGGQAQRIALARAFLSPARFLILDEPAAHLDPESEQQINLAIRGLAGGRTVLVITHRPWTFQRSAGLEDTQQLFLEDGRVRQLSPAEWEEAAVSVAAVPGKYSSPPEQALGLPEKMAEGGSTKSPLVATRYLLSLLTPFVWPLMLAALLGFAAIASGAGLMGTAAYILSRAAWPASIADLQVAIVGVRFFGLGKAAFRYLERLAAHRVTLSVLAELRLRIYRAIEPLAPARLVGTYHTGGLLNQLTSDVNALDAFYVRAIAPPVAALFVTGAVGAFFGHFDARLALGMMGLLVCNGVLLPGWAWILWRQAGPQIVAVRSDLKIRLVDLLRGMPDLLVMGQAGSQSQRVLGLAKKLDRLAQQAGQRNAWFNAGNIFFAHLAAWFVLVTAIPLASQLQISPLAVGALALVALACFDATQALPQAGQQLAADQAAAGRLLQVMDQPPAVNDSRGESGQDMDAGEAHVRIEDLGFAYPEDDVVGPKLVLDGLSLDLRPGKMVVLMGRSGAGKSTLINLLLRFWEFEQGSICLNGRDIRQVRAPDVRRHFAVVPQQVHLFNATLRDNLRLARPEAQDADLQAALHLARLDSWLSALPDGLDTWLGEDGLRLSGGERQRLALARASLQRAPFLLLDEPTAHLDAQTAREVMKNIAGLRTQCGILLITHHLDQEADFLTEKDDLIVLEQGKPVKRAPEAYAIDR